MHEEVDSVLTHIKKKTHSVGSGKHSQLSESNRLASASLQPRESVLTVLRHRCLSPKGMQRRKPLFPCSLVCHSKLPLDALVKGRQDHLA